MSRTSDRGQELQLPGTAASARAARRHVRAVLAESGREQWSEAAELAVSEVVTNGVLHAHTAVTLRVEVRDDDALIEVEDGSPTLPTQRSGRDPEHADNASTTGRGLALLSAVTLTRGVRALPTGKVVWFTVGDPPAGEADLLGAFDDDDDASWDVPAPRRQVGEQVVLQGMPPTLWMAAREHHQALLRELVLYLAEHGDAQRRQPDLQLADTARSLLWTSLLAELDRTRASGGHRRPVPAGHPSPLPEVPAAVDLEITVPPGVAAAFGALQDALDAAERLAVRDLLLVRPGLPEIVAVRDWACEQVVAQLAGVPASPWPGTDQERFTLLTHDRAEPDGPRWDASVVTSSARGVVAADDANRIIAVSDSLAAATGWEPRDLIGRRVVALIPPTLREAHVAGFSRHLTTGQAHVLGVPLELPVLHRDGTEIACSFLVERAESSGRPVYLAWIEPLEA